MLAIGCIQAQKCHTRHCPTRVATQDKRLARGLVPAAKAVRAANYVQALRHDMLRVAHAAGVSHPALIPSEAVEIIGVNGRPVSVAEHCGAPHDVERLHPGDVAAMTTLA